MPKRKEAAAVAPAVQITGKRPRLCTISVKNLRCIGPKPVVIDLDDIVVLVGPNNAGKSSILYAYQLVMSEGSAKANLTIEDFPNEKVDPKNLPQIELDTVFYDMPGERWIQKDAAGDMHVRERWTWNRPGPPDRQGFDVQKSDWVDEVPFGAANVAQYGRPIPHRVDAFEDPKIQADEIIGLLTTYITERIAGLTTSAEVGSHERDAYEELLENVATIRKKIVSNSAAEIEKVEAELTKFVADIFPNHEVSFDAREEQDIEKCISFYKGGARLLMGPKDGHKSPIALQGSGARRTILWTALRLISETPKKKGGKTDAAARPHVLLLDEPEICLHPSAIREACRVLYNLPHAGNWQVMVTTHSPAFVDLSRDNTTIMRVERTEAGDIEGTTVFRPEKVKLDDDDKARLKLLNLCDPYVAEFFFGGRTIVVEGDTEYTAFTHVIAGFPAEFKNVHIIRARGKDTIVPLVKILNHFGTSYSVLHDSDKPTLPSGKANSAWKGNEKIRNAVDARPEGTKARVVASITNFESAYLTTGADKDKPYHAIEELKGNPETNERVKSLLKALLDHAAPVPAGAVVWNTLEELKGSVGAG